MKLIYKKRQKPNISIHCFMNYVVKQNQFYFLKLNKYIDIYNRTGFVLPIPKKTQAHSHHTPPSTFSNALHKSQMSRNSSIQNNYFLITPPLPDVSDCAIFLRGHYFLPNPPISAVSDCAIFLRGHYFLPTFLIALYF